MTLSNGQYRVFYLATDWDTASAHCATKGLRNAAFNTDVERSTIAEYARETLLTAYRIWIPIRRLSSSQWYFHPNKIDVVTTTNWFAGQPKEVEDCSMMRYDGANVGKWESFNCAYGTRRFIFCTNINVN